MEKTIIECQPYHWEAVENFLVDGEEKVLIRMWALDKNSDPVLARIEDYLHSCLLELPKFIKGKPYAWNVRKANEFFRWLEGAIGEDKPTSGVFCWKKKVYYKKSEQENKYPMICLHFKSLKAMNHLKQFFKFG